MLNEDYSTKLLDMEHMKITNIDLCKDKMVIHVEMERRETVCPNCGTVTDTIHDYRMQTVKDCPVQGHPTIWNTRSEGIDVRAAASGFTRIIGCFPSGTG